MDDLLLLIDTFRAAHGMSESKFGRMAVKDAKLIPQLRAGREPRRATIARVRNFMATFGAMEAA